MNRRNFISGILAVGASFTVLPGTGRIWKQTPVDPFAITGYKFWMEDSPYYRHSNLIQCKASINGNDYVITDIADIRDPNDLETYQQSFQSQMERTRDRLRKGVHPPFHRLS